MIHNKFVWLTLFLVVTGMITVFALSRGGWHDEPIGQSEESVSEAAGNETVEAVDDNSSPPSAKNPPESLAKSLGLSNDQMTSVGGITRPRRDVDFDETNSAPEALPKNPLSNAGRLPTLKGDENPQVAALVEELRQPDGGDKSRSTMFIPKDFDREKYFENPQQYLEKTRPGRAFASAQPQEGVKPLAAASNRFTTVLQNEKAVLRVKADPNYPVTFYTPDGGEFGNRLKTITVVANQQGVAEAVYTAVTGTKNIMDVVAASPLHSGQVRFAVKVVVPDP